MLNVHLIAMRIICPVTKALKIILKKHSFEIHIKIALIHNPFFCSLSSFQSNFFSIWQHWMHIRKYLWFELYFKCYSSAWTKRKKVFACGAHIVSEKMECVYTIPFLTVVVFVFAINVYLMMYVRIRVYNLVLMLDLFFRILWLNISITNVTWYIFVSP